MKKDILKLINISLEKLKSLNILPKDINTNIIITPTKKKEFGDLSTNIALMNAKFAKKKPNLLAQDIINNLPQNNIINKIEIAGAGFINFFLKDEAQFSIIENILQKKENFGKSLIGKNQKINLEFVSANPTGPLHVGHGRGAAIGSAIASLLENANFNVTKEYYVNDAGRQMDILAISVYLRYLELNEIKINFPTNAYKGKYIFDIAQIILNKFSTSLIYNTNELYKNVYQDFDKNKNTGDKEKHIDDLIKNCKSLLQENYEKVHSIALNYILDDIKDDLKEFKVNFDVWFSEKSLLEDKGISKSLNYLKENNYCYKEDKALWFKSKSLGDEKDRVLVRDNGQATYFASDCAYMKNKFDRDFKKLIYIFGADHHGYVPRLMSIAKAFKYDEKNIKIPLIQFAVLYRNGEQVQMSTRTGSFITLRELRNEVGADATRFFYIMRRFDQHLDFDLELAKSKSSENPVYYIQYAYARICSVFSKIEDNNLNFSIQNGLSKLSLLINDNEKQLANKLIEFERILEVSALKLEPHILTNYLRELSNLFHSYYNSYKFILENDINLTNARLCLIKSIQIVIKNSLTLLGINTKDKM